MNPVYRQTQILEVSSYTTFISSHAASEAVQLILGYLNSYLTLLYGPADL